MTEERDLELFKEIDPQLAEFTRQGKDIYGGPSVAFAYLLQAGHRSLLELPITFQEDLTPGQKFAQSLFTRLRTLGQEEEEEPDKHYRFRFSWLFPESPRFSKSFPDSWRKPQIHPPTLLYVSVGTSPHYSENSQDDLTDAMYSTDRWGNRVLLLGLEHNQRPFWATSDYNFSGIPDLGSVRVLNSGLAKLIDSLQPQAAAK